MRKLLFGLLLSLLSSSACIPAVISQTPEIDAFPGATVRVVEPTSTTIPEPNLVEVECLETYGQIEVDKLASKYLPDMLPYRIYLPPCYQADEGRQYPVLFLIHGQTFTEDQWVRLGAATVADKLISSGQVTPFIIVMPFDKSWAQPTEDPFAQALVEELVPHIDLTYRTINERDFRAVGGLSRGASWAIHFGFVSEKGQALFGALGIHSPAVFWTDAGKLPARMQDYPREALPRIFVDAGDRDFELKSILSFIELLSRYNIPHEWRLYTGYHEESYWQAHVEEYLRWYAAGWEMVR